MNTINDRMEILVNDKFSGNKAAFAKSIDMQPTAISGYLGKQRRSKPSVDMVVKIVNTIHVNPWWLLTGEGEPYGKPSVSFAPPPVTPSQQPQPSADIELLNERIKALEALLAEKERLISVLLDARK